MNHFLFMWKGIDSQSAELVHTCTMYLVSNCLVLNISAGQELFVALHAPDKQALLN